jgi:hypothetical protein
MPHICKFPNKTCSLEAERFVSLGKDGPKDPKGEAKIKRDDEDGIFFHGMDLYGCCEAHQFLKHTRVPDLYQISKAHPFADGSDARWLPYAAVGGYSAGRKPFSRYVAKHGKMLKYAFLLDPSYGDNIKYGEDIFAPWLSGGADRRLLVLYGNVSAAPSPKAPKGAPPLIEEWLGGLRGLDEKIRKKRIVVFRTKEDHLDMRKHICAMEDPAYKPKGGVLDEDFAKSF